MHKTLAGRLANIISNNVSDFAVTWYMGLTIYTGWGSRKN
jgi:hypothetical protein